VAACDRIRSTLGWQPRFEDLQTIVAHALAWERKLSKLPGLSRQSPPLVSRLWSWTKTSPCTAFEIQPKPLRGRVAERDHFPKLPLGVNVQ
jgi:hypothetical protein